MEKYMKQLPYANQPQIDTINNDYELVFGLELDTIFLFHEMLLIQELRKAEGNLDEFNADLAGERARLIEKYIEEADRIGMAHSATERKGSHPQYKGWGIRVKPAYNLDSIKYSSTSEGVRTYSDEPMQIAKEVLGFCPRGLKMDYYQGGAPMIVHVNTGKEEESIERLGRWSFTNQNGLLGLPKHLFQSFLERRKLIAGARSLVSPHDRALIGQTHFPSDPLAEHLPSADDWDSHGMQLRSRVLTLKKGSFTEILDVLETMKGTYAHLHGVSLSNRCGLTVQIGRPDNSPFDLLTLQHLAFLLVTYEDSIDSIHPLHRRSTYDPESPHKSADEDPSCRYYWRRPASYSFVSKPEPPLLLARDSDTGQWIPSQPDHQPLSKIRNVIFHPGMTITKLANLMGTSPAKCVDWSHILPIEEEKVGKSTPPPLRTLIFRQHEGSLDHVHIEWWVLFCASLIRLAHQNAQITITTTTTTTGTQPAPQLPPISEEPPTLLSLLAHLSFPQAGIDHFSRRAAYYAAHTQPRRPPFSASSPTSTTFSEQPPGSASTVRSSPLFSPSLAKGGFWGCSRVKDNGLEREMERENRAVVMG